MANGVLCALNRRKQDRRKGGPPLVFINFYQTNIRRKNLHMRGFTRARLMKEWLKG